FIKRLVLMPEDDEAEGWHAENLVEHAMERGADWLSVSPAARKSIGKFFATAGQDHRLGLDRGSSVRTSAESREGIQQLPKKIRCDAAGMVQPFASSGTLN